MSIKLTAIDYYLPKNIVTNSDLEKENPDWDLDSVEKKSGVLERHIARQDETALDLAVEACTKLFSQNPTHKQDIDAAIFCTQSPDHIMPPNSYLLQKRLGLSESIIAYDFNLHLQQLPRNELVSHLCSWLAQGLHRVRHLQPQNVKKQKHPLGD